MKKKSLDYYFFVTVMLIVIFEGSFRKWLGVSGVALLLIRDFFVCVIIIRAYYLSSFTKLKKLKLIITIWSAIVILFGLFQNIFNQNQLFVMVLGFRFWVLYLWFALAVACQLNEYELRCSIKLLMIISMFMMCLAFFQSVSSPSSFINIQPNTDSDLIFRLSGNMVRASGTFSFTLGYSCFVSLMLPFLLTNSWKKTKLFSSSTMYFGLIVSGLVLTMFSGSRAAIIWGITLFLFTIISDLLANKSKGSLIRFILFSFLSFIFFILVVTYFQENINGYIVRFQTASETEDFILRIITIFLGEPQVYEQFNALGYGIGSGTNAASVYLTGTNSFLLAESEPGRIILEGGVFGFIWITMKAIFGFYSILWSLNKMRHTGDILPFLLALSCFYAFFTWPVTGQVSAHGIAYILLVFVFYNFRKQIVKAL